MISRDKAGQSGNVIFIILIAIVLLAALTFSVTKSMRGTSGSLRQEEAVLELNQIMQYGAAIENAITQMMAQGCQDDQISFHTTKWPSSASDWINPNSPANKSCHVFDPAGGGITFQLPPPLSRAAAIAKGAISTYLFAGLLAIHEVGTTYVWGNGVDPLGAKELLMIVSVPREICVLANSRSGITNPGGEPPQWPYGAWVGWSYEKFGSVDRYGNCCSIGDPAQAAPNGSELRGKMSGCYQSTNNNAYYLYKVLLAR